jgi:hypothetical protein
MARARPCPGGKGSSASVTWHNTALRGWNGTVRGQGLAAGVDAMSNNVLTAIFTPIVVAILLIVWIGGVFWANRHPSWGRRRDIKTEVSGGAFKAVHGGRQLMPIPGNWSQDVPGQRAAAGSETYQSDDVRLIRPASPPAADRPLVGASVSSRPMAGASASGRPAPGAPAAGQTAGQPAGKTAGEAAGKTGRTSARPAAAKTGTGPGGFLSRLLPGRRRHQDD